VADQALDIRALKHVLNGANQTMAVDFIHNSRISGRRFRAFAALDEWNRRSLASLGIENIRKRRT